MHPAERLDRSARISIRSEVHRVLAEYARGGSYGPHAFHKVFKRIADELKRQGIIESGISGGVGGPYDPDTFPNYDIPDQITTFIRDCFWALYIQRVLAPAPTDLYPRVKHHMAFFDFDYFTLTPYGARVLIDDRNRIRVHDPEGYLESFWSARPEPDTEMMRYLGECVQVFGASHLLAAVVLLGVASERLIDVLAAKLYEVSGGTWYQREYEGKRDISTRFTAVKNKLIGRYGDKLRKEGLLEEFETIVEPSFHRIRTARNEIAHPKGADHTWNEVSGLLHSFVGYFKHVNRIIRFLNERGNNS